MTSEIDYFRQRAAQEAELAEATDCPKARARHLDLANRYHHVVREMTGETDAEIA